MVSMGLLICCLKIIFLSLRNMLNLMGLNLVLAFYVQESLKDRFLAHYSFHFVHIWLAITLPRYTFCIACRW